MHKPTPNFRLASRGSDLTEQSSKGHFWISASCQQYLPSFNCTGLTVDTRCLQIWPEKNTGLTYRRKDKVSEARFENDEVSSTQRTNRSAAYLPHPSSSFHHGFSSPSGASSLKYDFCATVYVL